MLQGYVGFPLGSRFLIKIKISLIWSWWLVRLVVAQPILIASPVPKYLEQVLDLFKWRKGTKNAM